MWLRETTIPIVNNLYEMVTMLTANYPDWLVKRHDESMENGISPKAINIAKKIVESGYAPEEIVRLSELSLEEVKAIRYDIGREH